MGMVEMSTTSMRSMQTGVAYPCKALGLAGDLCKEVLLDVAIYTFLKLLLLLFFLPLFLRLPRRLRFRLQPCGHP